MNKELSHFAARLRELIPHRPSAIGHRQFSELALELFALQLKYNPVYRKICEARRVMPGAIDHWAEIPAVPTAIFKELDLTCLPPAERIAVFHSSGTTDQKPSQHYHSAESLKVYEASLWPWFVRHVVPEFGVRSPESGVLILTPPLVQAPHSSLVHMFETVRQKLGAPETAFVGKLADDGTWTLDFATAVGTLSPGSQTPDPRPFLLLGTAFSFVHLLDYLVENNLSFRLPAGSRVMETGGYKNRSRSMPKSELHQLITERLGVPPSHIICEYGMSELSSQAYDRRIQNPESRIQNRVFHFPPWARAQIISPETGREVAEGETGLIRIFDLANVFSATAIQTEDLGIRRGEHFELIGRAALAEARGCSLMTV